MKLTKSVPMFLFINITLFALILVGLAYLNYCHPSWSLARQVFIGLVVGAIFGISLQFVYSNHHTDLINSLNWFDVVGTGYVNLLQMIVMPLILVSILNAVAKLHSTSSIGKLSIITISVLLFTTFLAAVIGIAVTLLFGLTSQGLTSGVREVAEMTTLNDVHVKTLEMLTVPQILLSFIPKNPFLDLTGVRATSIIGIVIFSIFLGIATLKLFNDNHKKGQKVLSAIDTMQLLIMKLVSIVMLLAPYGVFALIAKMVAYSNIQDIINLGGFLFASYLSIIIMFMVHAILLALANISPLRFLKKTMPMLTFAFTSRSSAASIPLNIKTQMQNFGVPDSIASFSASFGATIGQNGCAGIYPAMLATMVAPTIGMNLDIHWFIILAFVVTLSSIGVAGVGGGATLSALIVLPIMGLPVELIALLISIEPLIDMARTALNVSGSFTAGVITSQVMGKTNKAIFDNQDE